MNILSEKVFVFCAQKIKLLSQINGRSVTNYDFLKIYFLLLLLFLLFKKIAGCEGGFSMPCIQSLI
jgi:hypothetical protein